MQRILGVIVGLLFASTAAQAATVGSIADSRFDDVEGGWTFDGSEMANARAKLLNPANFGPGTGTVQEAISIVDTFAAKGSVTLAALRNYDVVFIGYLGDTSANSFTNAELQAFRDYVAEGGTMIVTCDFDDFDAVCSTFGHPSANDCETLDAVNPMSRFGAGVSHPIFNGPFGTVTSFNGVDCKGFFTATAGSTILARDSSGVPKNVMLYRNHGLGRVILLGDVDFVAGALSAGNTITTANDRLLGNLFAFATAAGACVPSATVLCVDNAPGDRRFRVEISFQTVQAGGVSGFGQAIQLNSVGVTSGGVFWFFDQTNPEVLIKVLNGCGINNRFWVYYSAGTNVGFNVRVTDTTTDNVWTRSNPDLTQAPPVGDVNAFPCI